MSTSLGLRPQLMRDRGSASRLIDDSFSARRAGSLLDAADATTSGASSRSPPFDIPSQPYPLHTWVPSRGTFVFFLVALHLAALCYWCYLMYLSHRRAKAAAVARGEPRTPPPKVNCTYDWSSLGEADPESKGFFSRFRLKPFMERKNSGQPVLRSELAAMGFVSSGGTGLPSRSRITRTPTLPSTPELV